MTKQQLLKINKDIQEIIKSATATFYVLQGNEHTEIPPEDVLYELRAAISDKIGMYFVNLIK